MKKSLKIILIFVIAVLFLTALMVIWPYTVKQYEIGEYGITLSAPRSYSKIEGENILFELKNAKNNIEISVTSFRKDFFNKESAYELAESYKELIEAMNYDAIMQKVDISEIDKDGKKIGKVNFEVKTVNQVNAEVTIVVPLDENDVIITVTGTKDSMEKNKTEIEKIINSIKL